MKERNVEPGWGKEKKESWGKGKRTLEGRNSAKKRPMGQKEKGHEHWKSQYPLKKPELCLKGRKNKVKEGTN